MKLQELFESTQFLKTKEEIEAWLRSMKIENFTINSDLSVAVNGDVDLTYESLLKLPVQFGTVYGGFYCCDNNLTSLQGAPREVGGNFYCNNNKLTSLQGAPREVGRDFYCYNNNLTSLQGAPREVGGNFYCNKNNLTSLQGAPREVGRDFYCCDNNLPQDVDYSFINIGGGFEK